VTETPDTSETPDVSETPNITEDPGNPPQQQRQPTLAPPPAAGGPILIPVTGADLESDGGGKSGSSLFTNLGIMFLGLGLVLHGASRKFLH